MKIAVWHNLPSGGGKRALYDHVKGLVERGHTVESWCLSTADRTYLPLEKLVPEHIIPFEWKPTIPSRLVGKLFSQYTDAIGRLRAFDRACRQCAQEIESGGFDLLFANGSILYYMPFVMRHLQMPKVLYLQEPFRPLYEANPTLPWIAKVQVSSKSAYLHPRRFVAELSNLQALRIQAKEEWINAHSCDAILVNSYYSRESVLRVYGCEAKVCYLGVDASLFRHLHKEREHFIVGLGSFDAIKGIDLAINSIALLIKPRPPLIWISNSANTAYMDEMRSLAEKLEVDLQIKMRIPDTELVDILNRAALMIYVSHLEPFGYAPLEANACGTPVVAVAEGGVRETVQDKVNGLLVDRDPQCLAQAMSRLLHDPALARWLGENAVRHVQQEWSLERSIERLEARLLQVAHKPVSPYSC